MILTCTKIYAKRIQQTYIIKKNMNWYFHQMYLLKDIGMYLKVSKTSASMHDNKILRMILKSQNCNNCKCHPIPCKEKRCNIN